MLLFPYIRRRKYNPSSLFIMIKPHSSTQLLPDLIQVTVKCPFCGEFKSVELNQKEFESYYHDGLLIQHALPFHTPDDRELLVSGICPSCWPGRH
jgi:hypothetical protein